MRALVPLLLLLARGASAEKGELILELLLPASPYGHIERIVQPCEGEITLTEADHYGPGLPRVRSLEFDRRTETYRGKAPYGRYDLEVYCPGLIPAAAGITLQQPEIRTAAYLLIGRNNDPPEVPVLTVEIRSQKRRYRIIDLIPLLGISRGDFTDDKSFLRRTLDAASGEVGFADLVWGERYVLLVVEDSDDGPQLVHIQVVTAGAVVDNIVIIELE